MGWLHETVFMYRGPRVVLPRLKYRGSTSEEWRVLINSLPEACHLFDGANLLQKDKWYTDDIRSLYDFVRVHTTENMPSIVVYGITGLLPYVVDGNVVDPLPDMMLKLKNIAALPYVRVLVIGCDIEKGSRTVAIRNGTVVNGVQVGLPKLVIEANSNARVVHHDGTATASDHMYREYDDAFLVCSIKGEEDESQTWKEMYNPNRYNPNSYVSMRKFGNRVFFTSDQKLFEGNHKLFEQAGLVSMEVLDQLNVTGFFMTAPPSPPDSAGQEPFEDDTRDVEEEVIKTPLNRPRESLPPGHRSHEVEARVPKSPRAPLFTETEEQNRSYVLGRTLHANPKVNAASILSRFKTDEQTLTAFYIHELEEYTPITATHSQETQSSKSGSSFLDMTPTEQSPSEDIPFVHMLAQVGAEQPAVVHRLSPYDDIEYMLHQCSSDAYKYITEGIRFLFRKWTDKKNRKRFCLLVVRSFKDWNAVCQHKSLSFNKSVIDQIASHLIPKGMINEKKPFVMYTSVYAAITDACIHREGMPSTQSVVTIFREYLERLVNKETSLIHMSVSRAHIPKKVVDASAQFTRDWRNFVNKILDHKKKHRVRDE